MTIRRLYYDLCVIVGHRLRPPCKPFSVNCPAEYGLSYQGVFYTGNRKLLVLASGCQAVGLSVGAGQVETMIIGAAAAAVPASFTADLAAVLGVRPATVYQHPVKSLLSHFAAFAALEHALQSGIVGHVQICERERTRHGALGKLVGRASPTDVE